MGFFHIILTTSICKLFYPRAPSLGCSGAFNKIRPNFGCRGWIPSEAVLACSAPGLHPARCGRQERRQSVSTTNKTQKNGRVWTLQKSLRYLRWSMIILDVCYITVFHVWGEVLLEIVVKPWLDSALVTEKLSQVRWCFATEAWPTYSLATDAG